MCPQPIANVLNCAVETRLLTLTVNDRLDKALAQALTSLSRSAVQRLIAAGYVQVNDRTCTEPKFRVRIGDRVQVTIPDPEPTQPLPEPLPLDIVYEDEDLLVVNKPAGIAVHPGAGQTRGTLVNALLFHRPALANVGDPLRPGIVHRLDKETSGLVIVAKSASAHQALQAQFKARHVHKLYLALCVGAVHPPEGNINQPIGRHPRHRQRMAIVPSGRAALTHYATLARFALRDEPARTYSLVKARPITGRTHQLRVHFAASGFPIVGDAVYGARSDPLTRQLAPRQLLHAAALAFVSPSRGERVVVRAPLPEDFRQALRVLVRVQ